MCHWKVLLKVPERGFRKKIFESYTLQRFLGKFFKQWLTMATNKEISLNQSEHLVGESSFTE